jgi:hypothetical protein
MIDQIGFDDTPEKISPFLDEIFADLVYKSADQVIPKLMNVQVKSYPPHIISLINDRKEIRREKKKVVLENRAVLNTEYNDFPAVIPPLGKTSPEKICLAT